MSFTLLGILNAQAAAAGGAGAYDLLETTVLTSSAASVSFTGLDAYTDYKHLQIRAVIRSTRGVSGDFHYLRINGDSGTNYAEHRLTGNGSAVGSSAGNGLTEIVYSKNTGSADGANSFGATVLDILDFSNTNKNTTVRSLSGFTDLNKEVLLTSGLYINTAAVTSITLLQPFFDTAAGSRFSLYGLKG